LMPPPYGRGAGEPHPLHRGGARCGEAGARDEGHASRRCSAFAFAPTVARPVVGLL